MSLEAELLNHLNTEHEAFPTRVKDATNFIKSSELPVQSKIIVLKWILSNTEESEIVWNTLHQWFSSSHFKDITRNEIDTKDVKAVVEEIISRISLESTNTNVEKAIGNTVLALLEIKIFEHYFKIDVELYLKLIGCTFLKLSCINYFKELIGRKLFYKSLYNTNPFVEHFINFIPTLVKCVVKFDDENVFLQISRILQRCIFYNNHRTFGNFIINQLFKKESGDQCGLDFLIKHLSKVLESNKKHSELYFKLIFHAFAVSYESDSLIIHKFFLILIHMIGFKHESIPLIFDTSHEIPQKKKCNKILLELLAVLEGIKLDLNCTVNEISVTDLLKTILTESIITDNPSKINYSIIRKTISLVPTISQDLTEQILSYCLLSNNIDQSEEYEELMLVIFDLFSKLHRIENLISKFVIVLDKLLVNSGDSYKSDYEGLSVENILTQNILQSFSRNIQSLASWQVINVFKTLYHALKRLIDAQDGIKHEKIAYCLHMEILNELIGMFLSSIRVAEHTVGANVVEKTKICLNQLEELLQKFGKELLHRKHNCRLMRSFLNIAYHWAEVTILLRYYSSAQKELPKQVPDYNVSACNVTYLHTYLSVKEWCLISERITNFGELPCKQLMYKICTQKVRALKLFEEKDIDDVVAELSRYLTSDLEHSFSDILQDKFLLNTLVSTLQPSAKNYLAEQYINDFESFQKSSHILNNTAILNAVVYYIIIKCDKLMSKRKRKHDENPTGVKKISTKICRVITLEEFYSGDSINDSIKKMKEIYESDTVTTKTDLKFNENKILELLDVLKKFPVIFCQEYVQKIFLLYIFSVHKDLKLEFSKGSYKKLQQNIENLVIGVLQQYKFKLSDIFNIESVCQEIVNNFDEWNQTFGLVVDNIFKNRDSISEYEALILYIAKNLHDPKYMQCGITIMNSVNKLKKVKMSKEIKTVAENFRSTICSKICSLVLKNEPTQHLIPGYSYALKTYLAQNDEENVGKLFKVLESYTNFALEKGEDFDKFGYLVLFNTIFQNKPKIKDFNEELPLKLWHVCKDNQKVFSRMEEYSQLILLMICLISNEQFTLVISDLSALSQQILEENDYKRFGNFLKTWESIFTANINPVKTKILQEEIKNLLSQVLAHLENSGYNKDFYENILKFQLTLVQTHHFHLTPSMVDLLILNVTIFFGKGEIDFQLFFNLAASLLSNLLKYRKSLVMDRLPPYLQQYRVLLRHLCQKSDSDIPREVDGIREMADCAFQLEKLTKNLVAHQKDMSRIAMYLVADILEQYEKVTIYPNVKMHLNNCIYSLITICDQHAVSYLMRVLSSASTEIFKVMYENYKKYYRFTGKA